METRLAEKEREIRLTKENMIKMDEESRKLNVDHREMKAERDTY